jgi:hypothetical protein
MSFIYVFIKKKGNKAFINIKEKIISLKKFFKKKI